MLLEKGLFYSKMAIFDKKWQISLEKTVISIVKMVNFIGKWRILFQKRPDSLKKWPISL